VAAGRRSNQDRLDLSIRENLLRVGLPRAERLGQCARRLGLGIDDVEQSRVAALRQVLGMHAPDASGAEEGEVKQA
jgi:hypothetical protein